jgi:hypothetical protein
VPKRGTGEIVELPSITRIISVLDPKHICEWKLKVGILGAALREDLQVKIAAANLLPLGKPRNGELRKLAAEALTAGQIIEKGHLPADRGTGYHSLTERLDELVAPGAVSKVDELGLPRPMAEIARAYVDAMAGVTVLRTEVTVCSFAHGYAGTADRIIRFAPLDQWATAFDQYDLGRGCFVFDNKFGEVHDTAALQLAAIAGAETIWDAGATEHEALPDDLRRDIGFVFNPDRGLLPIDLTGAHDAFLGALAVQQWIGRKPVLPAVKVDGQDTPTADSAGEPVHISETLPKAVPADPFAGLPSDDGRPRIDRAAKRTWLEERIETLRAIPNGLEQLAARWPTLDGGARVPTFKETTEHTADQLALIEQAIIAAEAAVQAPLRDRPDPTDPNWVKVPNDDPRVLKLIKRGEALPPDLAAAVAAEAKAAKVAHLRTGRLTEAQLITLEPLMAAAEAEWMPRAKRINDALAVAAEHGVGEASLCAVLRVPSARHIHGFQVQQLDDLADAINRTDHILIERDGALVVDQPAALLAWYGGDRRRVLAAGQRAAKAAGIESPKDSDAVLNHPLLAAALAAV